MEEPLKEKLSNHYSPPLTQAIWDELFLSNLLFCPLKQISQSDILLSEKIGFRTMLFELMFE